ncbi:transcription initiation factor iib [Phaffia rhodozyma]|uniref:Transcription initiation factor IIB n=1 Tax=Phaffia rhodozyma TaxID=264483 RepID=A0A0F7SFW0_PHARH|nr:transcription initiation factor iib [Phaffia rhodozyma]
MSGYQPFPRAKHLQAGPKAAVPQIIGPDLSVRLICPECEPDRPEIIEEFGSGDLVCGGCGLVLGDKIVDTRSEWRTFANDEGDDPSRVGSASNPLDGPETFETSISFRDNNSGLSRELQRAAFKSSSKSEKTISSAFSDIGHLCEKISLGKNITDTAKQLFKRASEEGVLKGKPQEAVVAACIFIACRMGNSPRTFKEICTLTEVPKKLLGQCYKALERAFEVKASGNGSIPINDPSTPLPSTPTSTTSVSNVSSNNNGINSSSLSNSSSISSAPPPISSAALAAATGDPLSQAVLDAAANESETRVISQMLPRFISNLGLSTYPGFQGACMDVLIAGKALGLIDGRSPLTVVGSLLYFTTHLWGCPKTTKEVCTVVDTTEGTIRGRYKVLYEMREKLCKPEWLESGKADMSRLPN